MNTVTHNPPETNSINLALSRLEKVILDTLNFKEVVQKVCDSMLYELNYLDLGYRIVVLGLIDEEKKLLDRVAISQTEEARKAVGGLPFPFENVDIPLSAKDNYCIKVLNEGKPLVTHQWSDILTPPLTFEQAIELQKKVGIDTSMVYPLIIHGKPIGMMIFSMIKSEDYVSNQEKELLLRFTDIVALAVQNARLYTSIENTTLELQHANEKLKQLDRLKDDFVSVASHELRTPMTAIKSYLWMTIAGRGGLLNDKQKYYLERAYNSTDRLIKLVNDMLNVSRIEAGRVSINVEKQDIQKLVGESILEVKPRADELGLKIKIVKNEKLPDVIADTDKIKEVLINLMGNSMKFTPKGGQITISFEEKDKYVIVHVQDNGKGIEKDDLPKLFQKFGLIQGSYTTNQTASQGTGLGLYISKSIISLHKGNIWVQSDGRDKGSTFSFSLLKYNERDASEIKKEQEGKEGIEIIHTGI